MMVDALWDPNGHQHLVRLRRQLSLRRTGSRGSSTAASTVNLTRTGSLGLPGSGPIQEDAFALGSSSGSITSQASGGPSLQQASSPSAATAISTEASGVVLQAAPVSSKAQGSSGSLARTNSDASAASIGSQAGSFDSSNSFASSVASSTPGTDTQGKHQHQHYPSQQGPVTSTVSNTKVDPTATRATSSTTHNSTADVGGVSANASPSAAPTRKINASLGWLALCAADLLYRKVTGTLYSLYRAPVDWLQSCLRSWVCRCLAAAFHIPAANLGPAYALEDELLRAGFREVHVRDMTHAVVPGFAAYVSRQAELSWRQGQGQAGGTTSASTDPSTPTSNCNGTGNGNGSSAGAGWWSRLGLWARWAKFRILAWVLVMAVNWEMLMFVDVVALK